MSSSSSIDSLPLSPWRQLAWSEVARGWESRREECSYFIPESDIEGVIPPELVGTLFRNGPGISEVYGTTLKHPIDGDGVICAISFLPADKSSGRKRVHFRTRFVRTPHHMLEEYHRKFLFRGQMGTQTHSWIRDTLNTVRDSLLGTVTPLNYRNPSNTNVFEWGGKLLSLYETGLPISMDPSNLHTLGPDTLGGTLSLGAMAAHFRYDALHDRLVCISLRPGLRKGSALQILEFDRSWKLVQKQTHRIPYLNYCHDLALFQHHYVVHITPFVKITSGKVLEIAAGWSSPGEQMKYYSDLPSRMVVIPRDMKTSSQYRIFDVDPCHIFHYGTTKSLSARAPTAGATTVPVEEVTGLEFSAVCLPKEFAMHPTEHNAFLSNGETAPAKLCQFTLKFGEEKTPVHQVQLDDSSCEFPSTHPGLNGFGSRYTWMMANARGEGLPFRDIVKVDEVAAAKEAAQRRANKVANKGKDSPQSKPAAPATSSATTKVHPISTHTPLTAPLPTVTSSRKVYYSHGSLGEPIFIPRNPKLTPVELLATPNAEDDGWLYVQVYIPEKHTTDLVILDARNPQNGPVATIHLRHHLVYGFHATFTDKVFVNEHAEDLRSRL